MIERRAFVRDGQIEPDEIVLANQFQRSAKLRTGDLERRILHVELIVLERGILDLRRKRMRHRIAQNAETNRRFDALRDLAPPLQIPEGINFAGALLLFCHVERSRDVSCCSK